MNTKEMTVKELCKFLNIKKMHIKGQGNSKIALAKRG